MINASNMLQQLCLIMKKLERNPHRITKLLLFINRYNWDEIKYPSGKDDWEKCEKNSFSIEGKLYFKI